jgi:hypothetical protein
VGGGPVGTGSVESGGSEQQLPPLQESGVMLMGGGVERERERERGFGSFLLAPCEKGERGGWSLFGLLVLSLSLSFDSRCL